MSEERALPEESAEEAGLRYVSDKEPGYRRRRAGKGFAYIGPDGNIVKDIKIKKRLKQLAVPPAWVDVWICPKPNSHIQAVGRDARGRKQYIYHPRWRRIRAAAKFHRMSAFGEQLPELRKQVAQDLRSPHLARRKVVAVVVCLLDRAALRIGNEDYARQNRSYGATTLRDRHVSVRGATITLRFRSKRGKEVSAQVSDARLARAVRRCAELPGQELLQYIDDDGRRQTVDSGDVNEYLRQVTGHDFTAKDFRTWTGTIAAAQTLARLGQARTRKERQRRAALAVKESAAELGNTPTVSRKYYVHPKLLNAYAAGREIRIADGGPAPGTRPRGAGLAPAEEAVLALLKEDAGGAE